MPDSARAGAYVMLVLGEEVFGVPVGGVSSIVRFGEPTPVPHAPEAVMGVFNLRGRIVPIVDLRRRLSGVAFTPSPLSRVVVADTSQGQLGIAVDAATDVVEVSEDEIRPVPEGVLSGEAARAFSGVIERDGRIVILLDIERALPSGGAVPASRETQEGPSDA